MPDFDPKQHRIALIAGNGRLPVEIMDELDQLRRHPLLVGIRGEVDPSLGERADAVFGYGQLGSLFGLLEAESIRHVVFAGGIAKRPDFNALKLDMVTLKDLPKVLRIVMGGDNSVLSKIAQYFAEKDVTVVGAHQVVPELLATNGIVCGKPVLKKVKSDVSLAFRAAKAIGGIDAGQAAIVEDGRVIALEGAEGTDAMIGRLDGLRKSGRISAKPATSILAKTMKPGQDMRADLPTIGPDTIRAAADAGIGGVVLEADRTFILEREKTIRLANSKGLFILGYRDPEEGK